MALNDPQPQQAAQPPQSHDPTAFYPIDLSAIPLANTESLPQPTSPELWQAGHDEAYDHRFNSERERLKDAYRPILEVLNAGRPSRFWRSDADDVHAFTNPGEWASADEGGGGEREKEETLIWRAIAAARAKDAKALPGAPASLDELRAQIIKTYEQRQQQAAAITSRSQGTGGWVTRNTAGMIEGMNDPAQVASLAIGGMGKNFAQRILLQGVASGTVQAVEEPMEAKHQAALGDPLTAGQVLSDIGGAALGGSLFQLGIGEPLHVLGSALGRKIAARRAGGLTPDEHSAANVVEREQHIEATSPFRPGAGTEEHVARAEQARRAVTAEPGTVSITPPPAVTDPNARANFMARVRQRESGGSDTARPIDPATGKPLSSAVGRYQFTADTWVHYYGQRFDTGGLTRAQILAKRTDGGLQDTLMQDMTADNARHLARLGLPETAGNLYTEHFLGQGGAEKVFRADPNTPIESLLTAKAINANKFLRGKTAGDVIAWAHARMGEAPHNGPVLRRDLFGSDDEFAAAQAAVDAEERAVASVEAEKPRASSPDEPAPRSAIDPNEEPRIVAGKPPRRPAAVQSESPAPAAQSTHPAAIEAETDAGAGHLWRASPEELNRMLSEKATTDDDKLRFALGDEDAKTFKALDRARNSMDTQRADEAQRLFEEKFGDLTPRQERLVYGTGETDAQVSDIEEVLRAHNDVHPGDGKGWVAYMAAVAARKLDGEKIARVTAGTADAQTQAAFVRMGLAYRALAGHGVATADIPGMMVDAQVATGHVTPEQAHELVGSFVDSLARHEADMARAHGTEPRLTAPEAATSDREALGRYDHAADGPGPRTALESLEHDIRMDAAVNPDQTVRLSAEAGEQRIADVLEDLDADKSAVEAARRCMAPPV